VSYKIVLDMMWWNGQAHASKSYELPTDQ